MLFSFRWYFVLLTSASHISQKWGKFCAIKCHFNVLSFVKKIVNITTNYFEKSAKFILRTYNASIIVRKCYCSGLPRPDLNLLNALACNKLKCKAFVEKQRNKQIGIILFPLPDFSFNSNTIKCKKTATLSW